MGEFTEFLHRDITTGDIVMIDNKTSNKPEDKLAIPEYQGDAIFTYMGDRRAVNKVCLVSHSNDTDIIPLFSVAQAILLGDPTDSIQTVMLIIAVDKDEEELKKVN